MHVISMRSTLTTPARARGLPRDHETPGLRGSRMENSWDHSQAPLMNIQTQIDLFPVGTSYYSQILISLQIPPVPPAFPTCSSSGQDPGSRETGDRTWTWTEEGAPRVPGCAQPRRGQGLCNKMHAGQAGRAKSCSSLNLWRQLTEPLCHVLDSLPRGTAAAAAEAETGPVTLGKGKPTCFQLSPNRPLG